MFKAFKALKIAMTIAPTLTLVDFNKEFIVEIDASSLGMRVALTYRGRLIAYLSKALALKQKILFIYEKEMMVVLIIVKKKMDCLLNK